MDKRKSVVERIYDKRQNVHNNLDDELLPVFPSQAGLYVLSLDEEASIAYNMSRAYLFNCLLDTNRIKLTIQKLVDRHDSLRAGFIEKDGHVQQKVYSEVKIDVPVRYIPKEFDHFVAQDIIRRENNKPFELNKPPLIRALILQFDDDKSILVITGHHIIGDKLSFDIFIKEFNIIYNDINESVELMPAPSFIEYVRSRKNLVDNQKEYWKNKLSGCPPLLELPYDWSRPSKRHFRGDVFQFNLPKSIVGDITKICIEHHVTPYMIFCSAFLYLLNRLSKLNDIVVGTPVSNRNSHQQNGLFGYITDMMPIRVDLSCANNFLDIVKSVRKELLQGLNMQPICFHSIMNAVKASHHSNYNPLLQVYFLCENEGRQKPEIGDNFLHEITVNPKTSKCDLMFNVIRNNDEFRCEIEYDSDLFSYNSILWYSRYYRNIISQVIKDISIKIEDIKPINNSNDLFHLPKANLESFETMPLHLAFEKIAQKYPDKIALTFNEKNVTYKELNILSSKVANNLKNEGPLIGICMEPSIELIIGILGILKAGAAYVPLDIKTPLERIKQITSDAGVKSIITNQDNLFDFVKQIPINTLLEDEELLSVKNSVSDLAYVIHTSGTTGRPKGVMITHHNVHRLFLATKNWYEFGPNDTWILFHSYSFDVSVWEIWGALLHGGRLIIPSFIETRDPAKLFNIIDEVTVLNQTPSAFYQLLNYMKENKLNPPKLLRAVVFAGEALDFNKLDDWFLNYKESSVKMINMYGITETTVHVTYKEVKPQDKKTSRYSNIGKPMSDLSIAILDEYQNPVLPYIFGEIYVSGDGVGKGYLNQEELSLKRFININGVTHYRSGDAARYIEGQDIEYLGRLDSQVQLRGFRVELSEIQNCLNKYPTIQNSFICIRNVNGVDYLYAYYLSLDEKDISEHLRKHVKSYLPLYMIPHHFVKIDKIPLTINGKLDLSSLPLTVDNNNSIDDYDNLYQKDNIINILEELLLCNAPDLNKNFFTLGGDSLLGIRFISKIKALNLFIELSHLYQYSVADILRTFAPKNNEKEYKPFSLMRDQKINDPEVCDSYPLTPVQKAILDDYRSQNQFIEHSVLSYKINFKFIFGVWDYIVQKLSIHHPAIRSRISLSDDIMEVMRKAGVLCIVLPNSNNGLGRWYDIEKRSKFLLNNAPLIRFFIHEYDDQSFIVTMSYSDIILDKISARFILESCIDQYAIMIGQISEPNEAPHISKISQPLQFIGSNGQGFIKNASKRFYKCTRETVFIDEDLSTAIIRKASDRGILEENIFVEGFLELIKNYFKEIEANPYIIKTEQKNVSMIGQLSKVSQVIDENLPDLAQFKQGSGTNWTSSSSGIRILKSSSNNLASAIFSQKLFESEPTIFDLELSIDQIDSLNFKISIANCFNKEGLGILLTNILKQRSS